MAATTDWNVGGLPSGVEPSGDLAEFRGAIAHQDRELAPGARQRRLEALAVGLHQGGGDFGAAGLGRRGGAGLDAAAAAAASVLSIAAICSSRIWMRRCAPSTLRKAIAVSDSTSSRIALRWIAATSMPACARGNSRLALAEQLEGLADLQRGLGRFGAAIDAGAERIVLLVGQFRIEQRAGLDALARGDADIALRRRQARACGQRARERGAHRQGLGVSVLRQPGADENRHRARKARGSPSARHEGDL